MTIACKVGVHGACGTRDDIAFNDDTGVRGIAHLGSVTRVACSRYEFGPSPHLRQRLVRVGWGVSDQPTV